MSIQEVNIQQAFGRHSASIEGPNLYEDVHQELRDEFVEFAEFLDEVIPGTSREKYQMMIYLENASMWAHKAVYTTD